jgi:esterase/lipase
METGLGAKWEWHHRVEKGLIKPETDSRGWGRRRGAPQDQGFRLFLALVIAVSSSGVVLMAMPYKLRLEKFVIASAKILSRFLRYNTKFYPPTFGISTSITRLISYQKYPIKSALETFDLIKYTRQILPQLKQPCLLMQSSSDHIAAHGNLEMICENIGSEKKKKRYIKRAYHTFISDIKNEGVFEDILNFINRN